MTYFIGIDVHKKTSHVIVLDGDTGLVVLDKSIRSFPRRFKDVLEAFVPAKVLLEASTVSRWIAPWLRKCGLEVIVGDPNYALMYASRSAICKNDRNDARALAFALKNGHFRAVYEPNEEQRPIAELLGTRASQVRRRTAAINRTRALYAARGQELGSGDALTFWSRVKQIPLQDRVIAAEPLLDELAMSEDLVRASEKTLDEMAANHAVAKRLVSVPGVASIVSLSFYVKIGDPTRFRNARHVESYLGLVPTLHTSADAGKAYRISKRGSRTLRALLINSAWSLVSSDDPRALPFKELFQKLELKRGTQKAIVAVARRLAGILWAIWRDGNEFELREPKPGTKPPETQQQTRARRYQLKPSSTPPAN
jgi:transposase